MIAGPHDLAVALEVALPNPASWGDACPAWIESAGRKCGKPRIHGYLCARHHTVALKRFDKRNAKEAAQEAARAERAAIRRAKYLPEWREQLARVEAEIARRDPPPPTTDRAAFGGVGSTAARRYQARTLSDSNIARMAWLVDERDRLRRLIGPEGDPA